MQDNTRKIYNVILNNYVSSVPKDKLLTVEGVDLFLDQLRAKGFNTNTLRLYYYSLKKSFSLNNVEIKLNDPPVIDDDEVNRHIYKPSQVIKLIKQAREMGGIYSKAMALSTTYGLRRTELSNFKMKDLNLEDSSIKVKAAKHGRTALHLVPTEIMRCINNDIEMKSIATMSRVFNKIANIVGINEKFAGWHSIRRALVSSLVREANQDKVIRFMRWKTRTMIDIYHIKDPREDLYIFERHPFLPYWALGESNE